MIGYIRSNTDFITGEELIAYIEDFKAAQLPRLRKLKNYYDTKNEFIGKRVVRDNTKPNNKTATPYADYITTLLTGYFLGKPVTYDSLDPTLTEYIADLAARNKDSSHNQHLSKNASIYGVGYEILYLDHEKNLKYANLSPESVIPIFDNDIERTLRYAIRFYEVKDIGKDDVQLFASLYTDTEVQEYKIEGSGYSLIGATPHYFKGVPINVYLNNDDATGDFEKVIPLIDAYDVALSDTSNFREELNDSYLVFKNTNLDESDVLEMKSNRVICIEDSTEGKISDVAWLNKDSKDSENENHKKRLDEDIKKFSYVSDLETAKSHTTATSAKIGLMGIEQVCADKEAHFRDGLYRRFTLIGNLERVKGYDLDASKIKMTFIRNIPIDLTVIADTVVKLSPIVSRETLLSQIPFVNNIQLEIERKEKEESVNLELNAYDEEDPIAPLADSEVEGDTNGL